MSFRKILADFGSGNHQFVLRFEMAFISKTIPPLNLSPKTPVLDEDNFY